MDDLKDGQPIGIENDEPIEVENDEPIVSENDKQIGDDEKPIVSGKEHKKNRKNNISKKIVAIVLIVLLAAGAGFGGGMAALYFVNQTREYANITITPNDNVSSSEAVAEKVIPSVVGISTTTKVTYQSIFGNQDGEVSGVGTGIIVDKKGYILTNSHVVEGGSADTLKIKLADGREVKGTVLWSDNSIDLAIVKITADKLMAATLGDSNEVKVGSFAVAIGNPLGMSFESSVTQGVISGLNRSITVSKGQSQSTMDNLIQTDASINSGNSGGPLLNSEGNVIGINSAKAQSAEGLGFAIPINTAKPIIDAIKTNGEFHRAYIGIKGISVAEYQQMYPEIKLGVEKGVYINQIFTESPAAKAGMKEGDIITAIENEDIDTMTQLINDLYKYKSGDTIKLKIISQGNNKRKTVNLELGEMPN